MILKSFFALLATCTVCLAGWNGVVCSTSPARPGTITRVDAVIVTPTLSSASAHNSVFDAWLGIDGIPLDGQPGGKIVIHAGVDTKWWNGAQYNWAWLGIAPKKVTYLDRIKWPIVAGDHLDIRIEWLGGDVWKFTITNRNSARSWSFSDTRRNRNATRTSAQFIVEPEEGWPAPVSGPIVFLDCLVNGTPYSQWKQIVVSQDGYTTQRAPESITVTQP